MAQRNIITRRLPFCKPASEGHRNRASIGPPGVVLPVSPSTLRVSKDLQKFDPSASRQDGVRGPSGPCRRELLLQQASFSVADLLQYGAAMASNFMALKSWSNFSCNNFPLPRKAVRSWPSVAQTKRSSTKSAHSHSGKARIVDVGS